MRGSLARSTRRGAPAPMVWWLTLLLLLANVHSFAGGLEAHLDRTRIAEGDTVVLTLRADGNTQGTPDLQPLAKDFDVLNQSQSTHMQIINGNSSSWREWQIALSPKHSGKLVIPALHMGGVSSSSLSLEVLPASQAAKLGDAPPVLLQVQATPDKPYVQGQVIYTVRLLTRVPLGQASLTDPVAGDAIVKQLGKDRQSTAYHDGRSYQEIERRYAIFPQHSGKLHIQGPVLSAQVPVSNGGQGGGLFDQMNGGQDPFSQIDRLFGQSPFASTRPVQLQARPVDVDVQPQPAGTPSPWLPAKSVRLSDQWSPDPPVFQVGVPVTRSIVITARGLSADQLPNLPQPNLPGISQYPDQPETHTAISGDTVTARKVIKIALVPSQAGRFTLPAVTLNWWNTETGKEQVARLPARTIQVAPGSAGANPAPSVPATSGGSGAAPAPAAATSAVQSAGSGAGKASAGKAGTGFATLASAGYWPWSTALMTLLWLISTGLWLTARRRPRISVDVERVPAGGTPRPDPGPALKACREAFIGNNPRAARQALLDWGAACWPGQPPRQLEQLAQHLPAAARVILEQLDRRLYASDAGDWDGGADWKLIEPLLKPPERSARTSRTADPLPPLYE